MENALILFPEKWQSPLRNAYFLNNSQLKFDSIDITTLKFWKQLNVVLHAKAIRQERKTDLLNIYVYTYTQQQQNSQEICIITVLISVSSTMAEANNW